jgi:hypothetical protein
VRALVESVMVGVAGAAMGGLVLAPFGLAPAGAVIGGLNGAISGATATYRWRSPTGVVAFVLDSTWGLAMVAVGLAVHAVNLAWPQSGYRLELSRRTGYHVYAGGVFVRRGFAWTVGNVMSNCRPTDERRRLMLVRHEGLHVWQHRVFGPLFPLLYAAWVIAGGVAGTLVWVVRRGSWWRTVDTIAYFDNPFETWAYRRDERWPHPRADRALSWGRNRLR